MLAALNQGADIFLDIPNKFMNDREIILLAVKNNINNLKMVKE